MHRIPLIYPGVALRAGILHFRGAFFVFLHRLRKILVFHETYMSTSSVNICRPKKYLNFLPFEIWISSKYQNSREINPVETGPYITYSEITKDCSWSFGTIFSKLFILAVAASNFIKWRSPNWLFRSIRLATTKFFSGLRQLPHL
jgi:hypothetical protein